MDILFDLFFWYTFVVISWMMWLIFLTAFLVNNRRDSWLMAQICLMLGLFVSYKFERKRIHYFRQINENCKDRTDVNLLQHE